MLNLRRVYFLSTPSSGFCWKTCNKSLFPFLFSSYTLGLGNGGYTDYIRVLYVHESDENRVNPEAYLLPIHYMAQPVVFLWMLIMALRVNLICFMWAMMYFYLAAWIRGGLYSISFPHWDLQVLKKYNISLYIDVQWCIIWLAVWGESFLALWGPRHRCPVNVWTYDTAAWGAQRKHKLFCWFCEWNTC